MREWTISKRLMGSTFTLGVVSDNQHRANEILEIGVAEIQRIEGLLSEFIPESEVSKINNHSSDDTLAIDRECFDLIDRSIGISQMSHGAFDITTAPLKQLYKFKKEQIEMPPSDQLLETLRQVGYHQIKLSHFDFSIQKSPETRISFAAIGKGYASDKVKGIWQLMGVSSGYINASGDLNAFGCNAEGKPWLIGVNLGEVADQSIFNIPISNMAVATSGDAEQHFYHQGKRYSHNINPFTGLPLSGIKGVTVISPSAELSDALATAIYVKGEDDGIEFVNQLPRTHCIIVNDRDEVTFSKDIDFKAA